MAICIPKFNKMSIDRPVNFLNNMNKEVFMKIEPGSANWFYYTFKWNPRFANQAKFLIDKNDGNINICFHCGDDEFINVYQVMPYILKFKDISYTRMCDECFAIRLSMGENFYRIYNGGFDV